MTNDFIAHESFEIRLRRSVSAAWSIFSRKVGGKLTPINKEASMQLQYAYVLRQLLPLACHRQGEQADLELETSVTTSLGRNNVDILLRGTDGNECVCIAIELKCYRAIAASGGVRGAQNIFMKDVYEDLAVLERYVSDGVASHGVALVMTDHRHFVRPSAKRGDCWAYDISHEHHFPGGTIAVPIAGRPVNIGLARSYTFNWQEHGQLWFLELEGIETEPSAGTGA